MEQEERKKAVSEHFRKALDGLHEGEITEQRIRSLLNIDSNDPGLTFFPGNTVVSVDHTFGRQIFIKLGPPTWVQYNQHLKPPPPPNT